MRTSTSIGRRILLLGVEWGAASTVREELLQAAGDGGGDELADVAAKGSDLLDAARGHETDLRARHHVDRLDLRRERPVELVHLELPLEIGDDTEPFDDHFRVPAAGEIDDELAENVDLDVRGRVAERFLDLRDALGDVEQRRLVMRIADHADDDPVE